MLKKFNSHLSIGTRIAAVSALFGVSALVPLGMMVKTDLDNLAFSQKEQDGVQYLQSLWSSMQSGQAGGDAALNETFNATGQFSAYASATTEAEREEAAAALFMAIADGSNLTLDPELATYYLMDGVTNRLPTMAAQETDLDVSISAAAEGNDRIVNMAQHIDRLNIATTEAVTSFTRAMDAEPSIRASFEPFVNDLRRVATEMVESETGALRGDLRTADASTEQEFPRVVDGAWRAGAGHLDDLLQARIDGLTGKLTFELCLSLGLLLLAGFGAYTTVAGLSRRFGALGLVMDDIAEGKTDVEVPFTDDQAETGKIASTLEAVRHGMEERVTGADGYVKAISRAQAVIEFKPDGTIITANENFLKTMGYSLNEIAGQHHSMFATPEFARSPDYRSFWDKLNRGEFVADKFLRLGKGGKEVWIQASYNPITDKNGKVVKVVKFASDITESEKLAQEATFKSAAFAASSIATMMIDRDFKVTYVNDATKALLTDNAEAFRKLWPSFDASKIIGTCIDIFHKNPAHQRQMLSDPSRLPYRTDINVGDLKFALNVGAVYDAQRRYVGNVLQWDNVTTTRMNAGMLQALDRAQAIIEFNLDGTILNANENFCQTLGYSKGEIVGKHHSMFVEPAAVRSPEYKAFWEKLNRGEFDTGKYLRLGKGGKQIWIEATYNPILDGNGKAFKVVKFASDVTQLENDRKAAETERAARAEEQARVVRGLAEGLGSLAAGDLTSRISEPFPGEYEKLRSDFNNAMGTLQEAMKTIVVNAGGIRTGAGEISQAADDLSRRTEQQAASLEETAAALDEITATVRKTADGAKQANNVVIDTRGDAETSGKVVQETIAAMAEIEKSSKQISQIIGVIDEIAFQTNLLALNAGVEAARAGEAGRGFAVVASEVRALAQRSSEAAKEIKGLISASSQHVETGVELVGEAGKALQLIVSKVGDISGLVSEIAASAQEQSTALAEVNTAINQMDQVTQQNAAMVEESTAASHSLNQEAEELMGLIARFETGAAQPAAQAPRHGSKPSGQPIAQQRQRVAKFASSGSAAVKADDDWQEF